LGIMPRTKIILIVLTIALILSSCILPFEPNIEVKNINKLVVSGQLNDNTEYQTVYISKASSVGKPDFIPLSNCYVRIFDAEGNEFDMAEELPGTYKGIVDRGYMTPGSSFMIKILTPDGDNIESDFDMINECPDIDSVYYIRKDFLSDVPDRDIKGIQFYVNLDGGNVKTRYFRWESIETWEYHSKYPREWYYDGEVHHIYPPDYSRMVCWLTKPVKNIYTLSTENLVENKYKMLPLHYVDHRAPKLIIGYSVLINQYALSEATYFYWDQLRINSGEQGGLYEKQPLSIKGNLHNVTHPDEEILGYFGVAAVKSKRLFISPLPDLVLEYPGNCSKNPMEHGDFLEIPVGDYPAFLFGDSTGYRMSYLSIECVDCLSVGGINVKPDFWPN
jgi:hypothetical protein